MVFRCHSGLKGANAVAHLAPPVGRAGRLGSPRGRDSLKARHIEGNPHVSLTYWDPDHEQVIADCTAEWVDDMDEKKRLWDLFKATPEPYGYDLAAFFQSSRQSRLWLDEAHALAH